MFIRNEDRMKLEKYELGFILIGIIILMVAPFTSLIISNLPWVFMFFGSVSAGIGLGLMLVFSYAGGYDE